MNRMECPPLLIQAHSNKSLQALYDVIVNAGQYKAESCSLEIARKLAKGLRGQNKGSIRNNPKSKRQIIAWDVENRLVFVMTETSSYKIVIFLSV